jgi:hypothetical protein
MLVRKKIREFAAANPLVNEKDVEEALALFAKIEKTRRNPESRVRFRIGRPYGTTITSPEVDQCEAAPLLRFSLD